MLVVSPLIFVAYTKLFSGYYFSIILAPLRQIEWGVQNRPITKNGVLPVHFFL